MSKSQPKSPPDLSERIRHEIELIINGFAFNHSPPSFFTKSHLRFVLDEIRAIQERLCAIYPSSSASSFLQPAYNQSKKDEIIQELECSIADIVSILHGECQSLIIPPELLECEPFTSREKLANLFGFPKSTDAHVVLAKRYHPTEKEDVILKEFIFHVLLGTHRQSSELEMHIVPLVGICEKRHGFTSETGPAHQTTYLVTRYMKSGNLFDNTRTPAFAIRERRDVLLHSVWFDLFKQAIAGVNELHAHSVIHRCVSSDNVLLHLIEDVEGGKRYQAVISDLSGAALYHKRPDHKYSLPDPPFPPLPYIHCPQRFYFTTQHGMTLGFRTSAPELMKDFSRGSPQSDVYSIGILLWQLLWDGRTPYYPNCETMEEVVQLALEGLEIDPGWSNEIKYFFSRVFNPDPFARPALGSDEFSQLIDSMQSSIIDLEIPLLEFKARIENPQLIEPKDPQGSLCIVQ